MISSFNICYYSLKLTQFLDSIVLEAMRLTLSSSSPRMATEDMQLTICSLSETKKYKTMQLCHKMHTDLVISTQYS